MNIKYRHLLNILQGSGYKVESFNFGFNKTGVSKFKNAGPVYEVYRELGGLQDQIPEFYLEWNMPEPNKIILLDEPLLFNRYRAITLRQDLYSQLAHFPLENYRRYCRNYEKECLKSGSANGYWSSKKADFHFGNPADVGDFFGNGPTGWKFQAFLDFAEDYFAVQKGFKIIRLSVYDNLMIDKKLIRLDSILEKPDHSFKEHLVKYVRRKIEE